MFKLLCANQRCDQVPQRLSLLMAVLDRADHILGLFPPLRLIPCLFAQCSAEPEHLLSVREPEDSQQ